MYTYLIRVAREKLFWLLPIKTSCYQLKTKNGWMVEYTMVKKNNFAAAAYYVTLLCIFLPVQVMLTFNAKKYLKMFPIDKFLPFLSTMRGSSSGSKSCEIVVWWFGDWFMLCKTLIWSLWPIVSKGSIKMRPPFLPLLLWNWTQKCQWKW